MILLSQLPIASISYYFIYADISKRMDALQHHITIYQANPQKTMSLLKTNELHQLLKPHPRNNELIKKIIAISLATHLSSWIWKPIQTHTQSGHVERFNITLQGHFNNICSFLIQLLQLPYAIVLDPWTLVKGSSSIQLTGIIEVHYFQ